MTFPFAGQWLGDDTGSNPLTRALERRKASGLPILDLTLSNPTRANIPYPEGWESVLGDRAVRDYDPDPRGSAAARTAIAAYYEAREGAGDRSTDPEDVFLTAGTSEGYAHLLKMLCGPGGNALVPRPSYPLLQTLADLEHVTLGTYSLRADAGWKLDRASLEGSLRHDTRIVFVVQPNNPTGSGLDADDAAWLLDLAQKRTFALVVDEVFADFGLAENTEATRRLRSSGPLVFTLNGLSKLLGLPQLKLAWVHVAGNAADKNAAKQRLEWMCDATLSVGAAPQVACAQLLQRRETFQGPILDRLRENLSVLRSVAAKTPRLQPLWPQAGWCVPLVCEGIVHAGMDDEAFAIRLLESEGVLVQPGYFYDFDEGDRIVLSLLPEPANFREGLERVRRLLD